MITLLMGILVLAGTIFGWYGHKASLRIEAWGRQANDRDQIVRRLIGQEGGELLPVRTMIYAGAPYAAPIGNPHFPAGAAH